MFFQAEDGIRDYKVTGVQTCALPIFGAKGEHRLDRVPAVRQPAAHVQRKVELGGCDLACGSGQGAAFAGLRPLASLAFTRAAISSSAVTSAAFQAKRAS